MATNFLSGTVAANDDATALQYNNLRKDVLQNAGDYETAAGDGDTVTLAIDSVIAAYAAGQKFRFQANAANTGAVTLNVNAIGAIAVKKNNDEALVANDIESGQEVEVTYDGTYFQMMTPSSNQEHVIDTLNAGEAINGGTLPVAVMQNDSDNELYACDGNDTSLMKFIGFAISNSTDGNPIEFQGSGIVSGFSGLSEGEKYYVQDDKTIGTTSGTYEVLVGIAISQTELLIQKGGRYASGTTTLSATGNTTITVGFKVSKVIIHGDNGAGAGYGHSHGGWTKFGGNDCLLKNNTGVALSATSWKCGTDSNYHSGSVDTITDTAFNLNNTKTNAPSNALLFWEAIGDL